MIINKNTDLEFSLQKGTEKGGVYTNFYTEDKGSASIRIRLSSNEYYLDLTKTDLKPVLFLFHEDGSIFEIRDFINVMPDKGLIQYNISDNVIAHAGKVKAKLFLKNTEQSVHVANFTFDIKDSGIEGAVEKEISVNILEDTVRNVMTDNAMGLLDDEYKEKINHDIVDYVANNPDKYKGADGKSLKYTDLTIQEKEDLKSNITNQAVTDFVLEDGVVTDKKIADKAIINTKLDDNFATVKILSPGEDLRLLNREGNYFKNTNDTLLDLPTELGNGAGKAFIITVNGYSQWHYVQTMYELNNDATVYVRTVKNQVSSAWHAQSDDAKIVGMANDQANIKMQYNLNLFEKNNNEVVPDKILKYYTAIQDIKITGVDNSNPVKIWVLSRNYSTWGHRIIIGQKVDGVWKSIIDTANGGGSSVTESTNGITQIEYTRNGITLNARIDYNVIQDNDRLLDHSAMTDEPYFIIRPEKIGTQSSGGSGGRAYDQSLNTTDNVRFASIKADSIEVGGELKKGTLQTPPTGLLKGDMWLDTTDSTTHPILRVMS